MNPNEQRLAELQAEIEKKKAEMAAIKADDQKVKADEMAAANAEPTEEQMALLQGRGLTGNRDADGNLVTESEVAEKPTMQEVVDGLKLIGLPTEGLDREFSDGSIKAKKILIDASQLVGGKKALVSSPEFQEAFGNAYDMIGDPLKVVIQGDEANRIDEAADKKIKEEFHDMDFDYRKDADSDKRRMTSIDPSGRAGNEEFEPSKKTDGFENEGGFMSVNEKDDFWKTQEGHDKALEMYGRKPAWIKEPTMIWNPKEQKYEKIKDEDKEEFEDLSTPAMSADIKKLFG